MSASDDYDDFLNNWLQHNIRHNAIMRIEGKTAKNVRDISELPEESEAMFLDGKIFDVVKIGKITNPIEGREKIFEIILKEK